MGFAAVAVLLGLVASMALGELVEEDEAPDGSEGGDRYDGTGGDDRFTGRGGNDLITGYGGDDTLSGGADDDWILGQRGDDNLTGGPGNDVIIGGSGQDIIRGGSGDDFVEAAQIVDEPSLISSIDGAQGFGDLAFSYALPGAGPDGADRIELGPGDDTAVIGGLDIVTGGPGADEFATGDWIAPGAPAVITDFQQAEDVLTFAHDGSGPEPAIEVEHDPDTGDAIVRIDGRALAILKDADPAFAERDIVLLTYA